MQQKVLAAHCCRNGIVEFSPTGLALASLRASCSIFRDAIDEVRPDDAGPVFPLTLSVGPDDFAERIVGDEPEVLTQISSAMKANESRFFDAGVFRYTHPMGPAFSLPVAVADVTWEIPGKLLGETYETLFQIWGRDGVHAILWQDNPRGPLDCPSYVPNLTAQEGSWCEWHVRNQVNPLQVKRLSLRDARGRTLLDHVFLYRTPFPFGHTWGEVAGYSDDAVPDGKLHSDMLDLLLSLRQPAIDSMLSNWPSERGHWIVSSNWSSDSADTLECLVQETVEMEQHCNVCTGCTIP